MFMGALVFSAVVFSLIWAALAAQDRFWCFDDFFRVWCLEAL
jgi:hypothetical protein